MTTKSLPFRLARVIPRVLLSAIFLGFTIHVSAHNKVVVIPMSGDDLQPLANIITVAKANGDFTNPITALNSIPTSGPNVPSASRPYLIVIAPGKYTLGSRLIMREYVSIAGSGQQATILSGSISSSTSNATAALVQGSNHAVFSDLKIENVLSSSGSIAIGLYLGSVFNTLTVENVELFVSGATDQNIGILNGVATPNIHDVTVRVDGGEQASSTNIGISNMSSPVRMNNLTISAFNGVKTIGINNLFSAIRIRNVSINAGGGTLENIGIYNLAPFFVFLQDIYIEASAFNSTADNAGIYNDGAEPNISNTSIQVLGGKNSRGVFNARNSEAQNSNPILTEVDITVLEGSASNVGVYLEESLSRVRIRRCSISATTDTVLAEKGTTAIITDSMLEDGNTGGTGTIKCYASTSDTGTGNNLDDSCAPI